MTKRREEQRGLDRVAGHTEDGQPPPLPSRSPKWKPHQEERQRQERRGRREPNREERRDRQPGVGDDLAEDHHPAELQRGQDHQPRAGQVRDRAAGRDSLGPHSGREYRHLAPIVRCFLPQVGQPEQREFVVLLPHQRHAHG